MITGLDINGVEILQAKRVFHHANLKFICKAFEPGMFFDEKFDIVLFAASVQYFPSLQTVLNDALSILKENGEIHITDSHVYKAGGQYLAAQRTEKYYAQLGCPEMAGHYYHHVINELLPFNHKILLNPESLFARITKKDPFYWISITP